MHDTVASVVQEHDMYLYFDVPGENNMVLKVPVEKFYQTYLKAAGKVTS